LLRPYLHRSNLRASWQLANTLVPIAALWALLPWALAVSSWLIPAVLVLLVLFTSRSFSLMHDCGHLSLFKNSKLNHIAGFLLGVMNAIPQHPWARGHAYHHRHNGNWDLYRGPSALVTTEEFNNYGPWQRRGYALLRHPLMLFPGGFFYLVIKPRVALLLGSINFCKEAISHIAHNGLTGFKSLVINHKSRYWYTSGEFWHLLANNICVITGWLLMMQWLGAGLFWISYSTVTMFSAAIMICIFFVQHNFEGSYAHTTDDWDEFKGAIEGSSYLKMPPLLNWFSADIGYHNIHHLCEAIPNYNLRNCHEANLTQLSAIKILTLKNIPSCFRYILWNREFQRLEALP
jgi:omega-6 fatty acid desaturase (delta-12 desaturase)